MGEETFKQRKMTLRLAAFDEKNSVPGARWGVAVMETNELIDVALMLPGNLAKTWLACLAGEINKGVASPEELEEAIRKFQNVELADFGQMLDEMNSGVDVAQIVINRFREVAKNEGQRRIDLALGSVGVDRSDEELN